MTTPWRKTSFPFWKPNVFTATNRYFSQSRWNDWPLYPLLQPRAHPVKDWRGAACATPLRLKLHIFLHRCLFVLSAQFGAVQIARPAFPVQKLKLVVFDIRVLGPLLDLIPISVENRDCCGYLIIIAFLYSVCFRQRARTYACYTPGFNGFPRRGLLLLKFHFERYCAVYWICGASSMASCQSTFVDREWSQYRYYFHILGRDLFRIFRTIFRVRRDLRCADEHRAKKNAECLFESCFHVCSSQKRFLFENRQTAFQNIEHNMRFLQPTI